MNQEEEIPTRVTRGALRRRSVDQEATPQKAIGTVTAGGTPKKSTSAAKKPSALNVIQESDGGRQASPVSGRSTRRRTSETVDTPTTVGKTNKLVQALKESEKPEGTGGRSRNSSLSEENVKAFNAGLEDVGHLTRSRTPVRLRPSQETFTSTPQSVPAAVRRSARRNSVTSDDGVASVQSLPVSTSKVAGALRARKDDTIIEEETGNEGSVSSENSLRSSNAQLNSSQITADSFSPQKRDLEKGVLSRGASKSPRFGSSIRMSNGSTRSKNVSFSESSQPEDNQTITTDKRMVLLLTDLRDTSLLTREPKVNDIITIPRNHQKVTDSKLNVDQNTDGKVNKEKANLAGISDLVVPQSEKDDNQSSVATTLVDNMVAENVTEDRNEISGVEALDSSLPSVQKTENTKNSDSYSNAWCQSVCGSSSKGIDGFSVQKQEAEKELMKQQQEMSAKPTRSSLKGDKHQEDNTTINATDEDEAEEVDEEENATKSFIENEAIEMECYQSGDSLDDDMRREMEENEIPEHGEDLGSEDTEEGVDQEESDEKDSFVVSDGDIDEELEMELLEGTDEASSLADDSPKKTHEDAETPKTSPKIDAEVNTPLEGNPGDVGSPKVQEEVAFNQSLRKEENVVEKDHSACTPDTLDVVEAVVSSLQLTNDRTTIASRKSLSALPITCNSSVMVTKPLRKSLPVCVKDRCLEETGTKLSDLTHSVEGSSGNNAGKNNAEGNKSHNISMAEDENDTMASHKQPVEEFDNESDGAGVKIKDEVAPKKDFIDKKEHPKKSMPNVTLVSSLFYLGGSKQTTRNNTTGGDGISLTSPPQPIDVKKSKHPGVMLANPFATDKSKTVRRSTGSLSCSKKKTKGENNRGSLPAKLNEDDEQEKSIETVDEKSNATQQQPESQSLELGGADALVPDAVNSGNAKDSGEKEKVKAMKVTKPLEAYDLDSILNRCNEVVRANKERKKVNSAVLQKKKDEKKLRRERKPKIDPKDGLGVAQENVNQQDSGHTMSDDEANDTNTISVSTGNDSAEQHTLNDVHEAKKKKKRKQKVKNYLLDELASIKKESVARALQHKLEQIKMRKQAKKERKLKEQNLLNKENGSIGTMANTEGIKAKLEKAKRNQLKHSNAKQLESNLQRNVQVTGLPEKKLKMRAAVSAFAVFQENNERSMAASMKNNEKNVQRVPSVQERQEDSPHLMKEETYLSKNPTEPTDSSRQDIQTKPTNKGSLADGRPTKMKRHIPENESSDGIVAQGLPDQLRRQNESKNDGAEVEITSHLPKQKVKLPVQKILNRNQECNEKALAGSKDSVNKLLKKDKKIQGTQSLVSVVSTALSAFNQSMVANSLKEKKTSRPLRDHHHQQQLQADFKAHDITKLKRKRFSEENTSPTPPQPAKLPKLKALQRLAHGFVEQTVTPEKERLKRNFGFVECQATPKAIGFKVQSVLPTEAEELRAMLGDGSKKTAGGRKKKGKSSTILAAQSNRSLPLPIWTSSGFFMEDDIGTDKMTASKRGRKANATVNDSSSSYKNVKGHRGFKLKMLREPSNGTAENRLTKPHLIDNAIVPDSVINFKRQQLLEKTAHLREKQKKVN
ncbi:uncharacterized protein LOC131212189 isoform X2 [Anopheles bellator]|uniref:uncharacterized protein LOC131212189 isoform X2 n=1 Tax=Anopheles bellator TaxID=139047 RepID=UPI0026480BD6|nr:uncharacterized protein LOC131212189 isoform X2 [Anopheles bellator]